MSDSQFSELKSILERQVVALENNSKNYERAVQAQQEVAHLYKKNMRVGIIIAVCALIFVLLMLCLSAVFPNLFDNKYNYNIRNRMMGLQNSTFTTTTLRG